MGHWHAEWPLATSNNQIYKALNCPIYSQWLERELTFLLLFFFG